MIQWHMINGEGTLVGGGKYDQAEYDIVDTFCCLGVRAGRMQQ